VKPLVLASSSPRRAELLRAAGIRFVVRAAAVDESLLAGETPEDSVCRLARAKAQASGAGMDELILAADTVVVVGGTCLGKPADAADAAQMLRQLSGRVHIVLTGVALTFGGFELAVEVAETRVSFARLSETEIAWYVASREPFDKAGAYAIQGLASRFVSGIDGSYSNVVGLPVELVYRLIARAGGDLLR
jgi:septum formation protein